MIKEKLLSWYPQFNKKKAYFLFLSLFFVLLLLSFFVVKRRTTQLAGPVSTFTPPISDSRFPAGEDDIGSLPAQPAPLVFFAAYGGQTLLPVVPSLVKAYTFKTNYSLKESLAFGGKFGLYEYQPEGDFVIFHNFTQPENIGILTFNLKTGSYFLQSYGSLKVDSPPGTPPTESVRNFLLTRGLIDETVLCNITYQNKEINQVFANTPPTYIECHRDWEKVGLPILGFPGVLNIPEGQRLTDITKTYVGRIEETAPDDPNIINTSTKQDGKIRPNDFNTLTVLLAQDGRILNIESNLRPITQAKDNTPPDLLTPQEALDQFLSHNSQLSLTIPAGSGVVDWKKVYPDNQAKAKKATIQDYLLTYLEKPSQVEQTNLVPHYLIRGTAQLESGYFVQFVETIPALKTKLSFLDPINQKEGLIAGASIAPTPTTEKSIKYGTFDPRVTVTSSPPPISTSTPTPGQPDLSCASIFSKTWGRTTFTYEVQVEVPGIGLVTLISFYSKDKNSNERERMYRTFLLKGAPRTIEERKKIREEFLKRLEDQFLINFARFVKNPTDCVSEDMAKIMVRMLNLEDLTIDQIYYLFGYSSSGYGGFVKDYCYFPDGGGLTSKNENIYTVNNPKLMAAKNVAHRFLDLWQQGLTGEWANKPNIFPKMPGDHRLIYDYVNLSGSLSECYITGVSPIIYLYSNSREEIKLFFGELTTYSDPPIEDGFLQVVSSPDGEIRFLDDRLPRPRLYYEYDRSQVSFSESPDGFLIRKGDWEELVRKVSTQLGLKEKETEDWVVDFRNTLMDVKESPYLKVSIVNQREVEQKLPLTIYPKPDTFPRIHLLIKPLDHLEKTHEPIVTPIKRKDFTALELGVAIKE